MKYPKNMNVIFCGFWEYFYYNSIIEYSDKIRTEHSKNRNMGIFLRNIPYIQIEYLRNVNGIFHF